MRKILTLAITFGTCALLAYVLWTPKYSKAEEDNTPDKKTELVKFSNEQLKAYGIEIQDASPGALKQVVRAPAKITIAPDQIAHVLPRAPGIVLSAFKNLGEQVSANEKLVSLESKEMAEAKSLYLSSLKKEQLAHTVFETEKNLHEKQITAFQDYRKAKNDWEGSLIDLELSRQKLHALGLNEIEVNLLPDEQPHLLRIYELRTPIAGHVIAQHVTPGELATQDHELYIIANLDKVWAEISIFSQDRPYIKKDQPVIISTHEGQKIQATLIYLSPIIDEETRTSTAIAEVDNSSGLWFPGTFAQAELYTEVMPVAFIIPKEAIQNIDGKDSLFILTEDGFSARPITLGKSDEKFYEVLSGLYSGEKYASKNTFLLKADLKKDEAEHMD